MTSQELIPARSSHRLTLPVKQSDTQSLMGKDKLLYTVYSYYSLHLINSIIFF
jgi:hypothetical protein